MSVALAEKIDQAITILKTLIKDLEDVEKELKKQLPPPTAEELEKLPWKLYKPPHRAGWIFSNLPETQGLVEAIKLSAKGEVEISEFSYRLSGPEEDRRMFVSRKPITTKQA